MVWNQYNLISRRPEQQPRKNCKEINRCFSLSNLTIFQDHCTLPVVLVPTLLLSLSEKDREIFDSSLPSPSVQVVRKQQLAAALSEVLNTLLCWFCLSMETNPFQTLSSGTHSVCSSNIHGRKCVSGKALVCVHLETEQAWLRCTYSSVPLLYLSSTSSAHMQMAHRLDSVLLPTVTALVSASPRCIRASYYLQHMALSACIYRSPYWCRNANNVCCM